MSTPLHVSPESTGMMNAPYAGPSARDAVAEVVGRSTLVRTRPYVPAQWRSASASGSVAPTQGTEPGACRADPLPPIAAFLADGVDAPVEDWPFADAGAATAELTGELRTPEQSQQASEGPSAQSMQMWNDDDLLDIMPSPVELSASDAPWSPAAAVEAARLDASSSEREGATARTENNESAARALETLAGRVRSGELLLSGYAPDLGEAAVLAAALAALLGTRRG